MQHKYNRDSPHHPHHHISLNCEGHWGTTDDLQSFFSIFPCSPLPCGTCRTPGLSIPWCFLPTSSSVCPVFFSLSLCLAGWFSPDLMNGRHDNTTAVSFSLRLSGGIRVIQLPVGSWHGLPRWWHGLYMRCVVSCVSTSFPWLVFFFWSSAVRVHDSQAYRKMDATRECVSRILELREILFSLSMLLSWRVSRAWVTIDAYSIIVW